MKKKEKGVSIAYSAIFVFIFGAVCIGGLEGYKYYSKQKVIERNVQKKEDIKKLSSRQYSQLSKVKDVIRKVDFQVEIISKTPKFALYQTLPRLQDLRSEAELLSSDGCVEKIRSSILRGIDYYLSYFVSDSDISADYFMAEREFGYINNDIRECERASLAGMF